MMLLEFGFENFEKVKAAFDPKIVTKAMRSTIPRTMRKARTNVSKEIRDEYTVKAAAIKETVTLTSRRTSEDVVSILNYKGGSLPVDRFSTSERSVNRRRGVSVKIKKGGKRAVVKGGFRPLNLYTNVKTRRVLSAGPTFRRKGKSRLPIERVFSLSVPQMINEDVLRDVERQIGIDANIELNRNLEFFQNKAAR